MAKYLAPATIVDTVIKRVGQNIVLATPLGAGKPNSLLNDFYQRAVADPDLQLTICTALTLQRPRGKSELEQRFIDLFDERIFGDYPDLKYELARTEEKIPANIKIIEFYFTPGKYVGNYDAQQLYISTNYTHVVRDVIDRGVNVLAQLVAKKEIDGKTYFSLSSNPDLTLDLKQNMLEAGKPLLLVAQVNQNLPFMYGDAMVSEDFFDIIMDDPGQYFKIFGPPKTSVGAADYLIGLYCSALIKDDGELQIGIGGIGDATIYNLLLRQEQNEIYRKLLEQLQAPEKFGPILNQYGDLQPFQKGLFGGSEMIVDGFMHLYRHGVLRKKVYDHAGLQRLLNDGLILEQFEDNILEVLCRHRLIHEHLSREDFDFLQHWGILDPMLTYEYGRIYTPYGEEIAAHINDPASQTFLKTHCLGTALKHGEVMHGAFFLGSSSFYRWLHRLPEEERKMIHMKSVLKINQLYGHELLDRLHRRNARFINTCMKYTLSGAAASDGLEDGQVVSGVGGQYNFVAMAQELPDGHSILNLRSTRTEKGRLLSNILPHYGHITIPRHLRDIVVTEYGIAFLRGKTDGEIIEELLKITDSRFQNQLLRWAKEKGKIRADFEIPPVFRNNLPESYASILTGFQQQGLFPAFPFGTGLTEKEIRIGGALKALKADLDAKWPLPKTLFQSLFTAVDPERAKLLGLLRLNRPKNAREWLYKKLVNRKLWEQRGKG